jgi:hypothetical protein
MTFDFDKAKGLLTEYNSLIGKPIRRSEPTLRIIDIIIAPDYGDLFSKFIGHYHQNENWKMSLALSGFDKTKVLVLLISYYNTGILFYREIDSYLRETGTPITT